MATLIIHDLDDGVMAALRVRAAKHGRSLEHESREILRRAVLNEEAGGLGSRIAALFADVGGSEIPVPPRTELPRAAEFPE